nr:hypothetical protein TetV2_00597 [Oceanusvirus sp.]
MNRYLIMAAAFLVTAFVIIQYGTFRCKSGFRDPLMYSLFGPPLDKYTDGWAASHFIFYGVLAYVFPEPRDLALVWIVGVVWELIEMHFRDHPFYLSDCSKGATVEGKEGWWYGRWEDIVVNTMGMIVGYGIRRYRFKV